MSRRRRGRWRRGCTAWWPPRCRPISIRWRTAPTRHRRSAGERRRAPPAVAGAGDGVYSLRPMTAARANRSILVLHGPNLNLLGTREPGIYGRVSLAELNRTIERHGAARGARVLCRQSNHEGELVDWIQSAGPEGFAAIVINPG